MRNLLTILTIVITLMPGFLVGQNIVAIEYFFDVDPGVGNAVNVPITSAPSVTSNFTVSTGSLSPGPHYLYVRALETNGDWTFTRAHPFIVTTSAVAVPPEPVQAMEYFIDTDPGIGNGVDIPLTAGFSTSPQFSVQTDQLSMGVHYLYLRAQDNSGIWGMTEAHPFIIRTTAPLSNEPIVALEYFIDADPGVGNATTIAVTSSQTINDVFSISTSALPAGDYILGVRAVDRFGTWSPTYNSNFSINAVPTLNGTIPDQVVNEGEDYQFTLPANLFSDTDGDLVTLTATLSDDSPLPTWLDFDDLTEFFSGMPIQQDVGLNIIKLTASDGRGGISSTNFNLEVLNVIAQSLNIFNVVTTRANGKHDFLKIEGIEDYQENTVKIIDRWGNVVGDFNGYNNSSIVFRGIDQKGNALPNDTYFFAIDLKNGENPTTGFFMLKN